MTKEQFELESQKSRQTLLKMEEPGPWTVRQVFEKIVSVMKQLPEMEAAMSCLDYALGEDYGEWASKPYTADEWEQVYSCYGKVNTGGSEGVYIDVYCHRNWKEANRVPFGTFKTLREDFESYILMGQISGAFTKLFEEWQWANRVEVWNAESGEE